MKLSSTVVLALALTLAAPLSGQTAGTAAAKPAAKPAPIARAPLTPDESVAVSVYKKSSPGVVHITTMAAAENIMLGIVHRQETGTGCIVSADGYVITNYHVIKGAQTMRVTLSDGTDVGCEFVGGDSDYDLAVLKLNPGKKKLTPIQLGDSSQLEVGRSVFVIGNPLGYDQTMTSGIISSLGRTVALEERTLKGLIQTDASINPGNSGGPLLDTQGRMIGMATVIATANRQSPGSIGLGFAIPVNLIKRIYPQLVQYHAVLRPDMGISLVKPVSLSGQDKPFGLIVLQLEKDGPAAAVGLSGPKMRNIQQGAFLFQSVDYNAADIIVAIDGTRTTTTDDLWSYLESKKPGDTVNLTIYRQGRSLKIPVKLASSYRN